MRIGKPGSPVGKMIMYEDGKVDEIRPEIRGEVRIGFSEIQIIGIQNGLEN